MDTPPRVACLDTCHPRRLFASGQALTPRSGFMTGPQLIRELRTSAPDVPVLAITLRRDAERRERALRAGAGEVLTMATAPKEIVDVTKQLVGE